MEPPGLLRLLFYNLSSVAQKLSTYPCDIKAYRIYSDFLIHGKH